MFHVEQSAGADASFRPERDRSPLPCCTRGVARRTCAFPTEAMTERFHALESPIAGDLAILCRSWGFRAD